MQIVIYTSDQEKKEEQESQLNELKAIAFKKGYKLARIFEEKHIALKKNGNMPVMDEMVEYFMKKRIQKVYIWEISVLGASLNTVIGNMEKLMEAEVPMYIHSLRLNTIDKYGLVNPMTHFMLKILQSARDMEKISLRRRMKEGYDRFRQNNKVGRKPGYKKSQDQILVENHEVVKMLKQGISIRNIMKLTGRSSATVQKVKKMIAI